MRAFLLPEIATPNTHKTCAATWKITCDELNSAAGTADICVKVAYLSDRLVHQ